MNEGSFGQRMVGNIEIPYFFLRYTQPKGSIYHLIIIRAIII